MGLSMDKKDDGTNKSTENKKKKYKSKESVFHSQDNSQDRKKEATRWERVHHEKTMKGRYVSNFSC